jgi:hypothetical protein
VVELLQVCIDFGTGSGHYRFQHFDVVVLVVQKAVQTSQCSSVVHYGAADTGLVLVLLAAFATCEIDQY